MDRRAPLPLHVLQLAADRVTATPQHGSVTVSEDGNYTYTPDPSYAHVGGSDSFTVTATDMTANPWHNHTLDRFLDGITMGLARRGLTAPPALPSTDTITVTVEPINHAPTITDDAFTTDQDTPLTIAAAQLSSNDVDADGDALIVNSVTEPSHGTLTSNADDSYTYAPAATFTGTDTFTYTVTDAIGGTSPPATVTVTVRAAGPTVVASITAVSRPKGLVLSRDATTLYVANVIDNTITVINTGRDAEVQT
ncbi:Ig-like domain-containing protein [Mycolicibacterium sp. CBM1]